MSASRISHLGFKYPLESSYMIALYLHVFFLEGGGNIPAVKQAKARSANGERPPSRNGLRVAALSRRCRQSEDEDHARENLTGGGEDLRTGEAPNVGGTKTVSVKHKVEEK